jgi:hypothetical protein
MPEDNVTPAVTPEVQALIDSALENQKHQLEAKAAAQVEEVRSTAAAALRSKDGSTDPDSWLSQQAALKAKNDLELAQIEAIMSNGKTSNALYLRDKRLWQELQAKRQLLKGHAPPVVVPRGTAFRRNDT